MVRDVLVAVEDIHHPPMYFAFFLTRLVLFPVLIDRLMDLFNYSLTYWQFDPEFSMVD